MKFYSWEGGIDIRINKESQALLGEFSVTPAEQTWIGIWGFPMDEFGLQKADANPSGIFHSQRHGFRAVDVGNPCN